MKRAAEVVIDGDVQDDIVITKIETEMSAGAQALLCPRDRLGHRKRARVAWRSPATGARGAGEWMPLKSAIQALELGKREHPELEHDVELEPEPGSDR